MDPNSSKATFSARTAKSAAVMAKVFRRLAETPDAERPYNLRMAQEIEARLPSQPEGPMPADYPKNPRPAEYEAEPTTAPATR